jgi:ATP-dependent protease ClpP protease subunit
MHGRSRCTSTAQGGNVTDGLAIHDAIREVVSRDIEVTIVVQGMAYSMGSVVLQAASTGRGSRTPTPGS